MSPFPDWLQKQSELAEEARNQTRSELVYAVDVNDVKGPPLSITHLILRIEQLERQMTELVDLPVDDLAARVAERMRKLDRDHG